ncbi:hypothetical protein BLOT_013182 [Blomia tropicalis]|nr:hypothetical protein BLOT_013182 [Blomia tropicalis]
MVFHINPSGYVPIQLIDAHDPIFAAISAIDSNGTFAQNQIVKCVADSNSIKFNQANDQWFRRRCNYNSILGQILMMVFTIRKIFDWYSIRSQQHAKRQKI